MLIVTHNASHFVVIQGASIAVWRQHNIFCFIWAAKDNSVILMLVFIDMMLSRFFRVAGIVLEEESLKTRTGWRLRSWGLLSDSSTTCHATSDRLLYWRLACMDFLNLKCHWSWAREHITHISLIYVTESGFLFERTLASVVHILP